MMWNWGGSGGWGMGFGLLFMILFWGLVILGIVALVRWLVQESQPRRDGRGPPPDKTPLEIVRERYARGEIDREEYERKSGTSKHERSAADRPCLQHQDAGGA